MKRHVHIYLSKGKRSKKKRGRERGRKPERDGSRKGIGGEGGRATCRSPVDDDPAWPVPDRSFERNIKINNISVVRYRCYYRAGAVACGVCALVVTVV